MTITNHSAPKVLPPAGRIQLDVTHVVKISVLNLIARRERLGPGQAHNIDWDGLFELDHNPLRVKRVVLISKRSIQIRIALPKAFLVSIVQPRIAVVVRLINRIAPARQPITVRELYRNCRFVVRRPVTLPAACVAPITLRIPMPRIVGEFRAQTITQRLEAGGQHRLNVRRGELEIVVPFVATIDRCAERVRWSETICGMTGFEIDGYSRAARSLSAPLSKHRDGLKHNDCAEKNSEQVRRQR